MLPSKSGSAPKPPKRPKRPQIGPAPAKVTPRITPTPTRPIGPEAPMFNPTARIDSGRVSQAPQFPGPYAPGLESMFDGSRTFSTPTPVGRVDAALGLLKREIPQANPTETPERPNVPYSTNYSAAPYSTNYSGPINEDTPANPDRQPSQILTDKEIQRKISRRGGFGLWGARSPIHGFDFEADRNTFGHTVDPITGAMRNHTGEDMGAAAGTPIYAPAGGIVGTATPNGGAYGNQIILDHGAGEESMYGHLSGMVVTPGQKVKKGDLIGYVGSTGRSTGPHLHWETWKDGQSIDPNTLFGRGAPPQEVIEAALAKFGGQQAPSGPSATPNNNELAHNDGLDALMQAIREQESGGDYAVRNGIGAMGAYQIMPSNISGDSGWDMEALGHNITGEEFLNNPSLQNDIARFKLRGYFKKYGAAGAAKAWYAGPGNANLDSNSPQYGGPSVNAYAESVLNLMRKYYNMGN